MKRRLLVATLILLLTFAIPITAFAQDYYFSLDNEVVDVYWNSDVTMSLEYLLTFTTQPSGHTIEFVDVGMPNTSFDFNSIRNAGKVRHKLFRHLVDVGMDIFGKTEVEHPNGMTTLFKVSSKKF